MRKPAWIVVIAASAAAIAACEGGPTAVGAGRLIARESLTTVNSGALPCCARDSGGSRITIVGGALRFYAAADYPHSVATPGGIVPAACVQEVPNGAHVAGNGVVTLLDGSTYLMLPCSAGTYQLTLTRRIETSGGVQTREDVMTSGAFSWARDALTIADPAAVASAAMTGGTITVTVHGQVLQFQATSLE